MMSVALPARYKGDPIESILLDANAQKKETLEEVDGFLMMELKPGRHKIELRYPVEVEIPDSDFDSDAGSINRPDAGQ